MNFQKQLSKNLMVIDTETLSMNDDLTLKKVRFYCDFYGVYMLADVSKKDIEQDFPTITGEGSSELWDSFEEQIEDTHWEAIKEMFLQHEKEHNEEYGIKSLTPNQQP